MARPAQNHPTDLLITARIPVDGDAPLEGELILPAVVRGIVVFVHGSGSSRHSPRNRRVAEQLRARGAGTLLFDLLTAREEALDQHTRELRFDIPLLAERLLLATDWLRALPEAQGLGLGYFGASTGAAAALVAAAAQPERVSAVVSRGGRPDLAGGALAQVKAPTLLLVGSLDGPVIELNERALLHLAAPRAMRIVPGAGHLFEEPGTLDAVALAASEWFDRHWPTRRVRP